MQLRAEADECTCFTYGVYAFDDVHIKTGDEAARHIGCPLVVARDGDHLEYPKGPGVVPFDFDFYGPGAVPPEELHAILCKLVWWWGEADVLWDYSCSSGIEHDSGQLLKPLRNCRALVMVDDASKGPALIKEAYVALWGAGYGHYILTTNARALPRALVDTTMGQPERFDFSKPFLVGDLRQVDRRGFPRIIEGKAPRLITAGKGMDIDLSEFHRSSPECQKARDDIRPAQEAMKARLIGEAVDKARAEGRDETAARKRAERFCGGVDGESAYLADDDTLIMHDGSEFTIGDVRANPEKFDGAECADPAEPDYRGDKRIAVIRLTGMDIGPHIYSHAHGGQIYKLPRDHAELFPNFRPAPPLPAEAQAAMDGEVRLRAAVARLAGISDAAYQTVRIREAKALEVRVTVLDRRIEESRKAARAARKKENQPRPDAGVSMTDFYAYLPSHQYLFVPTRALWPSESVNSLFGDKDDDVPPSKVLDMTRGVQALTWAPGMPLIVENRLVCDAGWIDRKDCRTLNLYRGPALDPGNAAEVAPWLNHIRQIYPDGWEHVVDWLAHRVQRPQEKINHALVLGGAPGIGKDTILEPVKYAIGPWNFSEVSPKQLMGRFNPFLKSVILRVSEARDLGDVDRYAFYETTKTIWAAPPDMLLVDDKNVKTHHIVNVVGGIVTTNHRTDGLYLPADDRRHFVLWSEATKEDEFFLGNYWKNLWGWYHGEGGIENVASYLKARDLSSFDPKKPPKQTPAFRAMVDCSRAPEEVELYDELDALKWPVALTIDDVIIAATKSSSPIGVWLRDRKNARSIPHKLERCGYIKLQNDGDKDGRWKLNGRNVTIYVRKVLSGQDQRAAAAKLRKDREVREVRDRLSSG